MLEEKALSLFQHHNPYRGDSLKNHNLRIAAFAARLAEKRRLSVDRDLLGAACHLHDMGLLIPDRKEPSYLKRSWYLVRPYCQEWGLDTQQMAWVRDALLFNHSLRPVPGLSDLGEVVRLGVQVEHSLGIWSRGLSWSFCRDTFRKHPRMDLTRVLLDFARITLFEDGPSQLPKIFCPKGKG